MRTVLSQCLISAILSQCLISAMSRAMFRLIVYPLLEGLVKPRSTALAHLAPYLENTTLMGWENTTLMG